MKTSNNIFAKVGIGLVATFGTVGAALNRGLLDSLFPANKSNATFLPNPEQDGLFVRFGSGLNGFLGSLDALEELRIPRTQRNRGGAETNRENVTLDSSKVHGGDLLKSILDELKGKNVACLRLIGLDNLSDAHLKQILLKSNPKSLVLEGCGSINGSFVCSLPNTDDSGLNRGGFSLTLSNCPKIDFPKLGELGKKVDSFTLSGIPIPDNAIGTLSSVRNLTLKDTGISDEQAKWLKENGWLVNIADGNPGNSSITFNHPGG